MIYAVEDAKGDVLAVTDDRDEAASFAAFGEERYREATDCGHPSAAGWAAARLPVTVRVVTAEEAEAILEEGVPELQREP